MRVRVVVGTGADVDLGKCALRAVRVGGTANLVGACAIKQDAATIETIPAAATPGTERNFNDSYLTPPAVSWIVNVANTDTIIVFYN